MNMYSYARMITFCMTQKVQKIFTFSDEHGQAVLRIRIRIRIRIHRIHMVFDLPDPDPLVPDPDPALDPDPSIIMLK